ncbi:hypothetical protein M433DRAFT_173668 [Acidomyces richmondensis BFW]|nr:MAG: hypothetical protein FE78DRAFT_78770 [Acidomyces sp. 'richmondensis']KYG46398.1 hypothetical protein M433DRAFT_173668 [Acidomyces richmondensis BFW]
MATFAKSTFSASSYATFRPTYPPSLYNAILAYHRGPRRLCLDLGCGPGTVSRALAPHFSRVIGTDPSPNMITQARKSIADQPAYSHVEFHLGAAEAIPSDIVSDGTVDCVVAGQAAHWFDFTRVWPVLRRLVRPGGTLAFWGYKDHVFVDFPRATEIMQRYAYDSDPDKLGSYWPKGREYLQDHLRIVQPPEQDWEELQRVEYEPAARGRRSGEGTIFMERALSIAETKDYVRTWSSFHGWQEAHPGQVARSKGGVGDVMDEMFDEIAREDGFFREEGNIVNIEWGSALILARRRAE